MKATPKREGRKSKRAGPPFHPYAVPADSLGIAAETAFDKSWNDFETAPITLLLPSAEAGPSPSPGLIIEAGVTHASPLLSPWQIAALALPPSSAFDFLLNLPLHSPHGVCYGDSLRFFCECAKLVLELALGGHYAPALIPEGDGRWKAAWEPVFFDNERVHLLARAMPPLCRAMLPAPPEEAGEPFFIVSNFLSRTLSAFIRQSLSQTKLQARRGRKTSPILWLEALKGDGEAFSLPADERGEFQEKARKWLSGIKPDVIHTPFRTCFRLESPEDGGPWALSFHLQARDDKSLFIPAERVFRERSATLTFLRRTFENPQERLLEDLGKASRLYPALEDCLRTAHPAMLSLDAEGAWRFLREAAPLLEESGFVVLLPPWWQKPQSRLGVRLKIASPAKGGETSGFFGLDSLVSYDWQAALGEETLSRKEFEQLARMKVPLVKLRGQWVEFKPEDIEKAISFFRRKEGPQTMRMGELLRIGLSGEKEEMGLPVLGLTGEGMWQDLLEKMSEDTTLPSEKAPKTFIGKLRPYQNRGLSWLLFLRQFGLGGCLADDMGLGKTIQLIALLLSERVTSLKADKPGPTLIVCPMSVVGNWKKEMERFSPSLKVLLHHGGARLSGREFKAAVKGSDLVLTTYALVHRDFKMLSELSWERIVLDEAQNIKNPGAKQTRAVKELRGSHRLALTGTPVENRLTELWSIMDFLNPGYLGGIHGFEARFAVPIERYRDAGKAETLKKLTQPFILRRLKTDPKVITDLPEKMEMKIFCPLTKEQATLYEAVVRDMMEKISGAEGMKRKGQVLAAIVKLKQICNHPAQFLSDGSALSGRSGKLLRLEEMLEEAIGEEDRALVFTQFSEMGALLRRHLQEKLDREVLFLHGQTSQKQREAMIQRFQEEKDGPRVFILSLKAGGVGLNLTAASHVFHFDRWWNPAVENQATDRAFRIGQKKNVQVHKFICMGTLEERIDGMLEEKKGLAERIIGSGESWLTEMSTGQIRKLFALSRESVEEDA
ncbi:MAG: DEAD/DEAH box helicase [bacterium]